ncbi:MAG: DUF6931 family protein [Methylocella sp.]
MSSRVRFVSAQNVFEAFADLKRAAAAPTDDCGPLNYTRTLLTSSRPADAIIFLAYLLPRREAVWWALQCVRAMLGASADDDDALRAADAWVRAPDEDNRRAALAAGNAGDPRAATTWLAFAAGRSGGSLSPPDQRPMPAPPTACAMAANTAVMMAACAGDPRAVVQRIAACAEAGIRFADGGDATVTGSPASALQRHAAA